MLIYHLLNKFHAFFFKEEEIKEIKEKYLILLEMYMSAVCDCIVFIDIEIQDIQSPMFDNNEKEEITKGEYDLYIYEYVNE